MINPFLISLWLTVQSGLITVDLPNDKILALPKAGTIVGTVNGKNITVEEVQKLMWDWNAFQTVQEIIGASIIEDEAKKENLTVAHEEVVARLETEIGGLRATIRPGWTFEDELRAQNASYSRLYLRTRTQLLSEKIVLKEFKAQNVKLINQIIIRPKDELEGSKTLAREKADKAKEALIKGDTWSSVVQRFSEDEATKMIDGRVGWIPISELPIEAREKAKTLKDGEWMGPLNVAGGFVFFRLEKNGPPPVNEFEASKNAYLSRNLRFFYQRVQEQSLFENKIVPPTKKPG